MENQKRICVAICFGCSSHFTGLIHLQIQSYTFHLKSNIHRTGNYNICMVFIGNMLSRLLLSKVKLIKFIS